jgi:hypothetical protein
MKTQSWTKLGLLFSLAACTASTEMRAVRPTTLTQAPSSGCALGVAGALATVDETDKGVSLTILSPADRIDELRGRARHAAALHGPGAREGLGHDGAHGKGGQHGLQAMQLPPATGTFAEIEGGARITLVPADAADKDKLVAKAREGAHRMNASTTCE